MSVHDKLAVARLILSCPDCHTATTEELRCNSCGRCFQPAEDGIISALRTDLEARPTSQNEVEQLIRQTGEGEQGANVVRYEQLFHDEQATYYDTLFADPLPLREYYKRMVLTQIYPMVRNQPFVVDLCCGTGKSSLPLLERGILVVGIDVSRQMLRIYQNKCRAAGFNHVLLIHADASRPPLRPASCHAITMIGGLHHIRDQAGCVTACCQALAVSGRLVFHEPLHTGKRSRVSRVLENLYALLEPKRLKAAIGRRIGFPVQALPSDHTQGTALSFSPYEKPFTSAAELQALIPAEMTAILVRSQGIVSLREFPSLLQGPLGIPLAHLVTLFDEYLAKRSNAWDGDAIFAVFEKKSASAPLNREVIDGSVCDASAA